MLGEVLFLQRILARGFAMQIDSNATAASRTDTAIKLAPELEQLLATLKLQVGQTTEAKVAQIVLLSDAEKLQLIAARETDKPSAGQQTLLSMLRSPNLNLVTLIVRDHSVTSLTNLPLTQNSQIQILVTPQGLRLLPPATPITQLPAQAAELALPQSLTPTMKAPKPLAAAITSPTRVGELPIGSLSAPNRVLPQTAAAAPKALLAAATSQALPIAQPLKGLLNAAEVTQQRIINALPQAVASPVTELSALLHKIGQLALDVTTVKPDAVRQAINSSGLLYEHRLVTESAGGAREAQAPPLSERDLKGLLIQLLQWSGGANLPPQPLSGPQSGADTLAQLMVSLARLWSPRQTSTKGAPAQQLSRAIQELTEKSLAQVQLQQFRTLGARLQDPSAPAQWHLDIPLKLPDTYGNLYLHLFEPRTAAEERRSGKQRKPRKSSSGRWRVFLELELDQLGALAAEVSVQDKAVEATLWSANQELRQRVHEQLDSLRGDLERDGVEVADLRCSANSPPEQKIRLDYSLIDVKT